jgi:GTP1/Obg family GTP-binding protein
MQNDIKKGQKELYDKIKGNIDTSKIKVVFNKVDIKFYPGEEDDEAHYFEKQKDNTVSKLGEGCNRENIYYGCFEPKPKKSDQEMQALKNMSVLGFEDFFNEL